jgi:hypothetical protein
VTKSNGMYIRPGGGPGRDVGWTRSLLASYHASRPCCISGRHEPCTSPTTSHGGSANWWAPRYRVPPCHASYTCSQASITKIDPYSYILPIITASAYSQQYASIFRKYLSFSWTPGSMSVLNLKVYAGFLFDVQELYDWVNREGLFEAPLSTSADDIARAHFAWCTFDQQLER